jgi:hypothetical protein
MKYLKICLSGRITIIYAGSVVWRNFSPCENPLLLSVLSHSCHHSFRLFLSLFLPGAIYLLMAKSDSFYRNFKFNNYSLVVSYLPLPLPLHPWRLLSKKKVSLIILTFMNIQVGRKNGFIASLKFNGNILFYISSSTQQRLLVPTRKIVMRGHLVASLLTHFPPLLSVVRSLIDGQASSGRWSREQWLSIQTIASVRWRRIRAHSFHKWLSCKNDLEWFHWLGTKSLGRRWSI